MASLTWARAAIGAGFVSFIAVASACKPNEEGPASYCVTAKSSYRSCEEPTQCDQTLAVACGSLDKALSLSTLHATQDCLESGICGNAGCLTRAAKAATPTAAHRDLASAYCSTCAPNVANCESDFYVRRGRLPGAVVLPYSDSVATAVRDACVVDGETCRSTFTSCALDTVVGIVDTQLDPSVADCMIASFQVDDEGASTGPGGGPKTSTCTPDNCAGCCRNDNCVQTANEAACGLGGATCETCSGTQSCKSGQCKEPCGPTNCTGCCDGDVCVAGTEVDKCGGGGLGCSTCTTKGASYICSKQRCIDGSCNATCTSGCCTAAGCQHGTLATACGIGGQACVECGYGNACGASQACELDKESLWDFFISSASIPNKNKSGASWDVTGGAADPYFVGYSSLGTTSHTGESGVLQDTHAPAWGTSVLKSIKAGELLNNFSFEIWDHDDTGDDFIGGCIVPLTASQFTGYLQVYTCAATASTGQVRIYFRIQKP